MCASRAPRPSGDRQMPGQGRAGGAGWGRLGGRGGTAAPSPRPAAQARAERATGLHMLPAAVALIRSHAASVPRPGPMPRQVLTLLPQRVHVTLQQVHHALPHGAAHHVPPPLGIHNRQLQPGRRGEGDPARPAARLALTESQARAAERRQGRNNKCDKRAKISALASRQYGHAGAGRHRSAGAHLHKFVVHRRGGGKGAQQACRAAQQAGGLCQLPQSHPCTGTGKGIMGAAEGHKGGKAAVAAGSKRRRASSGWGAVQWWAARKLRKGRLIQSRFSCMAPRLAGNAKQEGFSSAFSLSKRLACVYTPERAPNPIELAAQAHGSLQAGVGCQNRAGSTGSSPQRLRCLDLGNAQLFTAPQGAGSCPALNATPCWRCGALRAFGLLQR